jgi:tRNA A37 threonylcarbamoyladenosine dehydratase
VGLGAVGSYATEALTRAGVGHLRLVDHDIIRPSNLNRQLFALHSTVGRPKVEVALERVRDINPACDAEGLRVFCHVETHDQVLAGPPDLVVDAIDGLLPKLELLRAVTERGIPVISSMGAATRTDPQAVRIGKLSQVVGCPLARRLRQFLERREVTTDIPCVYSLQPADRRFRREPEAKVEGELERGRARQTLGSLPTLTGLFGLTLANEALRMLLRELFPGAGPNG